YLDCTMLVLIPGRSTLATSLPAPFGPPPRSAYGAACPSPWRTPPARERPTTSDWRAAAARLIGDANTVRSECPSVTCCAGAATGRVTTCDTTSPELSARASAPGLSSLPE